MCVCVCVLFYGGLLNEDEDGKKAALLLCVCVKGRLDEKIC